MRTLDFIKAILLAAALCCALRGAAEETIWSAAGAGDLAAVTRAIAGGADVNAVDDENGRTPLMYAAESGKVEVVKILIDAGAEVSKASRRGGTPLGMAAQAGRVEVMRYLVSRGADPNAAVPPAMVPLAYAASAGKIDAMRALIELGADVNRANQGGWAPLMHASQWGPAESVKWLVEHGAKIEQRDERGMSPLCYAASRGRVENIQYLLSKGAHAGDGNGETSAVGLAARFGSREAVLLLLDKGAGMGQGTESLVGDAAVNGDDVLVRELLKRRAPLDYARVEFKEAAAEGHIECVRLLVEAGLRLPVADTQECLDKAVDAGRFDMTMLLLNAKRRWENVPRGSTQEREDRVLAAARDGDVNKLRDALAGPPLTNNWVPVAARKFAEQEGNIAAAKVLSQPARKAGEATATAAKLTEALTEAARKGDLNRVRALLDSGADADSHDPASGLGAIHAAAEHGRTEVVALLLDRGAQVNVARGFVRYTPLRAAIANKPQVEVVKLLLSRWADPNAPSDHFTHLGGVAFLGDVEVARLLLDAKADVNSQRNAQKRTALMWAAARGHAAVAKLLLERGADPSLRDEEGATAMEIAEAAGKDDVVAVLRNARVAPRAVAGANVAARPVAPIAPDALRAEVFSDALVKGPDAVRAWLDRGNDPNGFDPRLEKTYLDLLVSAPGVSDLNRSAILKLMLERKADPARSPGLLTTAVYYGRDANFLRALIAAGADVNDRRNWVGGYTPLLMAAERGSAMQSKVLIDAGADVEARKNSGETALDLATRRKDLMTVQLLERAKAQRQQRK